VPPCVVRTARRVHFVRHPRPRRDGPFEEHLFGPCERTRVCNEIIRARRRAERLKTFRDGTAKSLFSVRPRTRALLSTGVRDRGVRNYTKYVRTGTPLVETRVKNNQEYLRTTRCFHVSAAPTVDEHVIYFVGRAFRFFFSLLFTSRIRHVFKLFSNVSRFIDIYERIRIGKQFVVVLWITMFRNQFARYIYIYTRLLRSCEYDSKHRCYC